MLVSHCKHLLSLRVENMKKGFASQQHSRGQLNCRRIILMNERMNGCLNWEGGLDKENRARAQKPCHAGQGNGLLLSRNLIIQCAVHKWKCKKVHIVHLFTFSLVFIYLYTPYKTVWGVKRSCQSKHGTICLLGTPCFCKIALAW